MYKTKGSQMYILLLKCVFAKFTINNIFCVHIRALCVWPCSDSFRGAFWELSFEKQTRAWNWAEPWQWEPGGAPVKPSTRNTEAQGRVNGESAGAPSSETGALEDPAALQTLSHLTKRTVLSELKLVSHKAPSKPAPVSSQPMWQQFCACRAPLRASGSGGASAQSG